MIVAGRAARPRRGAPALVAALVLLGGCGDDGGPEPDPEAFCRVGPAAVPVEDASADELAALADVAPEELRDDVEVLLGAAERLAGFDDGDPAALEAEFEIRFDPEYTAARDAVEAAVARCRRPGPTSGEDGDGVDATGGVDSTPTTEEDTP